MRKKILLAALLVTVVGCNSKKDIEKTLVENPEILKKAIEANPAMFIKTLQKAAKDAREILAKEAEKAEQEKLMELYDKPLVPEIGKDAAVLGDKNAPLVLVEYSDFECPFCSRGYDTVQKLRAKYGKKIQFIYKHLPLSFHKNAMIASQYFEAIKLQDNEKAFQFHDLIFQDQQKLKRGEAFLKALAKKVKVDMAKLKKDLNSSAVTDKINKDMKEAAKFNISGTPGFLLNGIPVKGAYPAGHFEGIVNELVKRGKVKL